MCLIQPSLEGWTMTTQDECDDAIREYRENSRSDWLLVAWAIAGGAIGSALVFISANSVFLHVLLD
jgi:hypothetical protein